MKFIVIFAILAIICAVFAGPVADPDKKDSGSRFDLISWLVEGKNGKKGKPKPKKHKPDSGDQD